MKTVILENGASGLKVDTDNINIGRTGIQHCVDEVDDHNEKLHASNKEQFSNDGRELGKDIFYYGHQDNITKKRFSV